MIIGNLEFAGVIGPECLGIRLVLAFLALCLATSFSGKKDLRSLVLALPILPLILLANLMRICLVFLLIHALHGNYFSLIHDVIFSMGSIAIVLLSWLLWLKMKRLKARR